MNFIADDFGNALVNLDDIVSIETVTINHMAKKWFKKKILFASEYKICFHIKSAPRQYVEWSYAANYKEMQKAYGAVCVKLDVSNIYGDQ